jgi:quercetin dioxygenase-like cupin family protein
VEQVTSTHRPILADWAGSPGARRVEILSDDDSLHATWSRFAPCREGADLHVHRRHSDVFYVLEGELTVRLGVEDEAVPVPAGTLARVPPMVVHGFQNGSDGTAVSGASCARSRTAPMSRSARPRAPGFDQHPAA